MSGIGGKEPGYRCDTDCGRRSWGMGGMNGSINETGLAAWMAEDGVVSTLVWDCARVSVEAVSST